MANLFPFGVDMCIITRRCNKRLRSIDCRDILSCVTVIYPQACKEDRESLEVTNKNDELSGVFPFPATRANPILREGP